MSTYLGLHYHIVFGTKNREPWIHAELRPRLHEYLGGTVNGLGGKVLEIGGVADHVHLLISLRATHCLADFVREIKKASSKWMKDTGNLPGFSWQDGYCTLTVSPSAISAVCDYIAGQEKHHRKRTFREEVVEMLDKSAIEFDPAYLD